MSADLLFESGRWDEAGLDFGTALDPQQDLIGDAPGNRSAADPSRALALAAALRARRPRDGALLEAAALILAGRRGEAARRLDRLLEARPRDAWARLWRFRLRSESFFETRSSGDLESALADADAAVRAAPRLPCAWAWRASFLASLDRYDEAVADLDRLLALVPADPWALAVRGEIFSETGRPERALADCGALAALFPEKGWPLALQGRARARLGDPAGAFADLSEALRREPEYGEVWAWRGEARRKSGDLAGARADLDRAVALHPRSPTAWLWRGKVLLVSGDAAAAAENIGRSVALDARVDLAHAWHGEALLKAGLFEDAAAAFDRAYPLHPGRTWTDRKGMSREESMRLDLDEAVARAGAGPWAAGLRGRLNLESAEPGRLAAAAADLDAMRVRLPGSAWAAAWLGCALWKLADARGALRLLSSALRLEPGLGWARAWRGRLLGEAGRAAAARGELERAARLLPLAPWPRLWLGELELGAGRPAAAAAAFAEAAARGGREPELAILHAEALRRLGRGAQAAASLGASPVETLLKAACLPPALAAKELERLSLERPDILWYQLRHPAGQSDPLGLGWKGGVLNAALARRLKISPSMLARLAEFVRLPPRKCLGVLGLPGQVDARRFAGLPRAIRAKDWVASCWRGEVLARLGRWKESSAEFESAARKSPAWALTWRAMTRLWIGREAQAIVDLEAALAVEPRHRLALGLLGEALGKLGRHAESVTVLDRALAQDAGLHEGGGRPTRWRADALEIRIALTTEYLQTLCRRGEARLKSGDESGAFADLDCALALRPDADWVHSWKGELLLWLGRREEALACLRRAVALNDSNAWAHGWLGGALVESDRWAQALPHLDRAIAVDPYDAESLAWRSEARLLLGRAASAMTDIARALALDAKYHLVYRGRGDGQPSIPDLTRALDALNAAALKKGSQAAASAAAWRGWLLRRLKRDDEAAAEFEAALAADPGHPRALAWRGELSAQTGRYAEARSDLDSAIAADPYYLNAYGWRGRALFALGDVASAVADFDKALSLDQKSVWIFAWRGAAFMRLGRIKEALADLDSALHLDGRDPTALAWRGRALLLSGRAAEAAADYRRALEVHAGHDTARVGLAFALGSTGDSGAMRAELARAFAAAPESARAEQESLSAALRDRARAA